MHEQSLVHATGPDDSMLRHDRRWIAAALGGLFALALSLSVLYALETILLSCL